MIASDPQGSALTFTWSSSAGTLGAPANSATTSDITWTAPDCLAAGSAPVSVTITNALGLSTSLAFEFTVTGNLGADYQPPFAAQDFELLQNVVIPPDQTLRYLMHLTSLTPEQLVFPVDQRLSVSFVSEYAGGNHTLGWMYVDDLMSRGYVDAGGNLVDGNANGIADLHEDLYNMAPPTGTQARPYVGAARRCPSSVFSSQGFVYSQPELGLNGSCASSLSTGVDLADARPGNHSYLYRTDVVGAYSTNSPGTGFSDGGLFPRVPNLLEPAATANGNMGLGRLVFLLSDDDSDQDIFKQLAPVTDTGDFPDGIPDYDVSRYDSRGLLRATNPDPGITPNDRTVDLGTVQGGREIVFFLITYFDLTGYSTPHDPSAGVVYPCLRKSVDGRCTLYLRTSVSVHFSKAKWNLDQDPSGPAMAFERDMGCRYNDACNVQSPNASACILAGTSQRMCGWLEEDTLGLLDSSAHGYLRLPHERTSLPAPANGNMAHLMMGAPSATPGQWILGFEDLNGGGDRDFNDVVFRLQATASGGVVRSRVLNQDGACKVSRVRFRTEDALGGMCGSPSPLITYAVAPDCKVCNAGFCTTNPTPTWSTLALPTGQNEVLLDFSNVTGSQLCWKADMTSPNPYCQPTIFNVDVGYESTPTTP
ncbi:DUF4114 domain-containing protein [Pyxidicoccus sp. 3LG]